MFRCLTLLIIKCGQKISIDFFQPSSKPESIHFLLASDESVFNNVFLAMSALKTRLYSTWLQYSHRGIQYLNGQEEVGGLSVKSFIQWCIGRFPNIFFWQQPSSIYSCSIGHILEHEFCHLGCWAVKEKFLKRQNFRLSKQLFKVVFSTF